MFLKNTKSWIEAFVIGYNLCPFAVKPFNEGRIRYVVYEGDRLNDLCDLVYLECFVLRAKPSQEIETTLIIHPNILLSFDDYLETFSELEDGLYELEMDSEFQLASFHPDYQFAQTDFHDAENFTNRSPHPMIHILRSDSVEKAIDLHPDTASIPETNIELLKRIGSEALIKKYNEIIRKD